MHRFTSRRSIALAMAVLAAAIAFPLAALAAHQFTDVPDSNPYHNDIDALADSGVTTGCGGGNFCPSGLVTREQMAAFLNRLGALGPGKTPVVNAAQLDGVTADQFIRSDVPVEGRWNCTGAVMQPKDSGEVYTISGNGRLLTSGTATFSCPVVVPDGATLTLMMGGADDTSGTEQVICRLFRGSRLTFEASPTQLALASSGQAFNTGDTTFGAAISPSLVDNTLYAYWAECEMTGSGADIVLAGVSVSYLVEGLPVP